MPKALNRQMISVGVGALALLLAGGVRAERIYKYTDEDGVTVLSNVPRGKARRGLKMRAKGELMEVTAAPSAPAIVPASRQDQAEYLRHLDEACKLYKIPVALARAVMATESNYDPRALSVKGAQGLMQLMPATAAEMFVSDAFEPRQNIHGGVRYLRVLANKFDGDMVRIIAAYNAGPDAVKRAGGVPNFQETQEYVRKVLRLYFSFKQEARAGQWEG